MTFELARPAAGLLPWQRLVPSLVEDQAAGKEPAEVVGWASSGSLPTVQTSEALGGQRGVHGCASVGEYAEADELRVSPLGDKTCSLFPDPSLSPKEHLAGLGFGTKGPGRGIGEGSGVLWVSAVLRGSVFGGAASAAAPRLPMCGAGGLVLLCGGCVRLSTWLTRRWLKTRGVQSAHGVRTASPRQAGAVPGSSGDSWCEQKVPCRWEAFFV